MEYEKYLIIFSIQENRKEYYYIDYLMDVLECNKELLNIKSISLHNSSLVNRCFTYILQKEGKEHLIGALVNFKVLKLTQNHPPFKVDELLDEAIKDCAIDIEGRVYALCFYLVEDEGNRQFHRFSRHVEKGVKTDDDHINFDGLISGHPEMFYEHMYGNENYNADDTAYLAKLLLTVDDGIEYDF